MTRALYNASLPSAYDITATTGNLMIQLSLSNFSSIAAKIANISNPLPTSFINSATATTPPTTSSSVLRGLSKQLSLSLRDINSTTIGGISWNAGPETSIYLTRPFSRGSVTISPSPPSSPHL
ncbi:hypothetical protein N0V83_008081 [Neocucurbitaria cava]|uniref:Uncharacterized protein n=1 Tax=Neocucurbitaria cava TaxID=798079 RepID=A0A9W8Y611_9PLEO|nr:hypothetical protein N0V83_008081 [Neocucurbitaria cava]